MIVSRNSHEPQARASAFINREIKAHNEVFYPAGCSGMRGGARLPSAVSRGLCPREAWWFGTAAAHRAAPEAAAGGAAPQNCRRCPRGSQRDVQHRRQVCRERSRSFRLAVGSNPCPSSRLNASQLQTSFRLPRPDRFCGAAVNTVGMG